MVTSRSKNIILLSSKSAGSSAVQKYLNCIYEVDLLPWTPHHENETLFWTKAASALRHSQTSMHRSIVPYSVITAKTELNNLLEKNDVPFSFDQWSEEELFLGYYALTQRVSGAFLEKSPHHLRNYSNLDLMIKAADFLQDKLDIHFVGLIRNPLDTIYSAWQRWRYHCPSFEREWRQSYLNLNTFAARFPEKVKIFRYEDLTNTTQPLDNYITALGVNRRINPKPFAIHSKSKNKWLNDKNFGHQINDKTIELAFYYGYHRQELENPKGKITWNLKSNFHLVKYEIKRVVKKNLTGKK